MLRPYRQIDRLNRIKSAEIPGFWKAYFIPIESVAHDPNSFSSPGVINVLPSMAALISPAEMLNGSKDYTEVQVPDDGGDYYDIVVEGLLPFESISLHRALDIMKLHRFIVIVTSPTGLSKWLGTKENPVKMLQSFDSGKRNSSNNSKGTSIRFTWRSASKPLLYDIPIPVGLIMP